MKHQPSKNEKVNEQMEFSDEQQSTVAFNNLLGEIEKKEEEM